MKRKPLSIRNNNPLNIKKSKLFTWKGEIGQDARGFVIFDSVTNGFRAAYRNMQTYRNKHGLTTIDGIINRWTKGDPAHIQENYKSYLENATGLYRDVELSTSDYATLILEMSFFEGAKGRNRFTLDQVNQGIALA